MIDHSSFSSAGRLFHARGAATEKALRRFVDASAARRGRPITKHTVQIEQVHRQLMSGNQRCTSACVQEATCGPVKFVAGRSQLMNLAIPRLRRYRRLLGRLLNRPSVFEFISNDVRSMKISRVFFNIPQAPLAQTLSRISRY